MKKTELIDRLKASASLSNTFIPVVDVISLVEQLDDTPVFDEESFECMVKDLTESIASEGVELIDDYSLEMQYREVILEDIDIDRYRLEKVISSSLKHTVNTDF